MDATQKSDSKVVCWSFGVLSPKISKQIKKARLHVSPEDVEQFDKDAEAILRLYLRGLLPDHLAHNCRAKLIKKIEKSLIKRNNKSGRPAANNAKGRTRMPRVRNGSRQVLIKER